MREQGTMGHVQGLIQLSRPLGDEARRNARDGSDDAGAEAKADKQRRKIQNRRNQRAHRQRLKGKDAAGAARQTQQQQRPFKVTRWRLDEVEPVDASGSSQDETSSPASTSEGGVSTTHIVSSSSSRPPCYTRKDWWSSPPTTAHNSDVVVPLESQLITLDIPSSRHGPQGPSTVTFPLSADHLIHLIQYNVLRALLTNKFVLNIPRGVGDDPESAAAACPISGLYRHHEPPDPNPTNALSQSQPIIIPPALAPTPLQKNHHHPIWVNAIPFPRIRDNFIRHTGQFNPWDLLYDLVGEFMTNTPDACVASHPKPTTAAIRAAQRRRRQQQRQYFVKTMLTVGGGGGGGGGTSYSSSSDDDDDDEVTAGRRGLIVWGEPHDTQSWEATPGFLAKWAWAVEGCEELVESSNRWRVQRGEEPMRLSVLRHRHGDIVGGWGAY